MKTKITIPEPCQQKWHEMLPLGKHKYCSSCRNIVTDFSKSSLEKVLQAIDGKSGICGRLNISQLDEYKHSKNKRHVI